jgi:hypothetical protein
MSIMSNILSALSRLSQLNPGQPAPEFPKAPTYRQIIADYLNSLENDADMMPEVDRHAAAYRRRAMTANFCR